jgi:hypothetical protein
MNMHYSWLAAMAAAASLAAPPLHHSAPTRPRAAGPSPCAADSSYQRLAFWAGDWEVTDSTGAHYATQRVRAVVDACAFTAEWTGRAGDKGLSLSAFDIRTGEWKQVYVSNQVPYRSGVPVRHSDSTYRGPGIRFIPLLDPASREVVRSRVTIMPVSNDSALQLFEDSPDGGKTWKTLFKAQHRRQ